MPGTPRRGRQLAAIGSVLVTTAALGVPGAAAQPPPQAAHAAAHSTPPVLAVRSTHGALLSNVAGHGMRNLGGRLTADPAVGYAAGRYFFLGRAAHGRLVMRTDDTGWAPLLSSRFGCAAPDLASDGHHLAVACIHHHAVYAARLTAPRHGLPSLLRLRDQGGRFTSAAVYFVGRQVRFEAVGTSYVDSSHFNTYASSLGAGRDGWQPDSQLNCAAPPAVASAPAGGSIFAACVTKRSAADGTGRSLETMVTSNQSGCGQGDATTVPAARVGIAPINGKTAFVDFRTTAGAVAQIRFGCTERPPTSHLVTRAGRGGVALAGGADGYR